MVVPGVAVLGAVVLEVVVLEVVVLEVVVLGVAVHWGLMSVYTWLAHYPNTHVGYC